MCQPLTSPVRLEQTATTEPDAVASQHSHGGNPARYPSQPNPLDHAHRSVGHHSHGCSPKSRGSRRHRLWELDKSALCPIIGVCLPLSELRRQAGKWAGAQVVADDYTLHCGTIAQCQGRNALSEALNKELNRRNVLALRSTRTMKDAAALRQWWDVASNGAELAAALWATLTHAQCDTALQGEVLAQVHMLQHQVGNRQRVEQARLQALQTETAALKAEIAAAQLAHQRHASAHTQQCQQLQADLTQARSELVALQTQNTALRQQQLAQRTLAQEKKQQAAEKCNAWQRERITHLERTLAQMHHEAAQHRSEYEPTPTVCEAKADAPPVVTPSDTATLGDQAILCVGGRPASVPLYRHIVERAGGRFLHHDGGDEHRSGQLESNLAAADFVICQTGCISHGAYWRVKDYCKRHGKSCVFVENPGSASLKRALAGVSLVDASR